MTLSPLPPDLTSRPFQMVVSRLMRAPAERIFAAWTRNFDTWLAAPGSVLTQGAAGTAFYFETHHGAFRAPYYGRFLRLEEPRLVEMTWLSLGTGGVETVLTIGLENRSDGSFPKQAFPARNRATSTRRCGRNCSRAWMTRSPTSIANFFSRRCPRRGNCGCFSGIRSAASRVRKLRNFLLRQGI